MKENPRLDSDFYLQTDVVEVAKGLLGKILVTSLEGIRSAGRITETEAYRAPDDRACHAYGNRLTKRTRVMFESGGRAYIYLCYGIHHLFNVVSGPEGTAHAVLVRAIEPLEGIDTMASRRFGEAAPIRLQKSGLPALGVGPGVLTRALGLTTALNGTDFLSAVAPIWIEDDGMRLSPDQMMAGPRVGVDYAGECAKRPWRFWIKDSRFVS